MFHIFQRNLVFVVLECDDLFVVALGNNIKIVHMNVMLAIMGENITFNVERGGEGLLNIVVPKAVFYLHGAKEDMREIIIRIW